jgi:hypothetical protein
MIVWVYKPLTVEAWKRHPQPIEKSEERAWKNLGQQVQIENK